MVNKVTLVGNLGADPDVRQTKSGIVCNLSVATSHRQKDNAGEWRNATEWHKVIVFDRVAENCQKYLSKGRQVYVEGRLQTRSYTGKDGVERKATEIVANQVKFLQNAREDERQVAVDKAIQKLDDEIPF